MNEFQSNLYETTSFHSRLCILWSNFSNRFYFPSNNHARNKNMIPFKILAPVLFQPLKPTIYSVCILPSYIRREFQREIFFFPFSVSFSFFIFFLSSRRLITLSIPLISTGYFTTYLLVLNVL